MRFFAIITVVIFHLNTAYAKEINLTAFRANELLDNFSFLGFGWWMQRLDIGVKVFFAISGFILALPFIRYYLGNGKRIKTKDYFIRRLTRLEPPYIISLFFFYLVHVFILNGDAFQLLKSLLYGIFYLHTTVTGVLNPINPVTWSLETEAQFYIIMPLLVGFIFFSKNRKWIYLIFIILTGLSIFFKKYLSDLNNGHYLFSVLAYLINFLVGIIIAYIYEKNKKYFDGKSFLWDIINVISVFIMFYFYEPQDLVLNIIILNLGIFIFFISVFKSKLINWFYTRPIIYTIGGMCYSIYLLHYAFFHLSVKFSSRLISFSNYSDNLMLQMLINLPLVLLVSSIFFVLFEKPFMTKTWINSPLFKLPKRKSTLKE